ncbi:uncharacterized protein N7484_007501 [Penicillium longicatenatum]|uniref:uncharacterized protein n=1 Tax=Penicillium longicatenatum TaxID=1561947 RepID=UPI002548CDA0|nr:uncharacterized protein N7484_007501 [Penicillium longicatenatum]KAJ5639639.1 hypothetical protein N7484_007501 [Penicillium longicatenatum]
MTSTHSDDGTHPAVDNSLDDIFGSSPPHETREMYGHADHSGVGASSGTVEPSDLPSLRRQHVTAGYREGVSVSKGERVQDGFDGGFPIGAQLGMRAGTILGILEGISRGLEDRSTGAVKKPAARGSASGTSSPANNEARRKIGEQLRKIYGDAAKALDVQAVFTGLEAMAASGSRVDTASGEITHQDAGEKPETQLAKKGDSVIAPWEKRLAVPAWEENMEALEMRDGHGEGDKGAAGERS